MIIAFADFDMIRRCYEEFNRCRIVRQKQKVDDSALTGSNRQPLSMRGWSKWSYIIYYDLTTKSSLSSLLKAQVDNLPVIGGDVLLVPFFW